MTLTVVSAPFPQTPEACERFDVRGVGLRSGVFIGIVTLRAAVDFEAEKHFDLSVRATDNGKRELRCPHSSDFVLGWHARKM